MALIGYGLCMYFSISYVAPLYFMPKRIKSLDRDDPEQIWFRIKTTIGNTLFSLLVFYVFYLNFPMSQAKSVSFSELIGFQYKSIFKVFFITLIAMTMFYLGPVVVNILEFFIQIRNGKKWNTREIINYYFDLAHESEVIILRNLIVAPICEELVFRSVIVPSLIFYSNLHFFSIWFVLFLSPICFSLAHVHHAFEKYMKGINIKTIIVETLVQSTYTYIFGFVATLFFTRSGSVVPCIVSHIICNFIGFPDLSFCKKNSIFYNYRNALLFLHGLGLVVFFPFLFFLTQNLAASSIYWY